MKVSFANKVIVSLLVIGILSVLFLGVAGTDGADIKLLLSDREFIYSVIFTLKTSLIAVLLAFIFGVPAGLYLAKSKSLFSEIIDVIFDIPLVLPPLVVGVMLLVFFELGFIRYFYEFIFTMEGAVAAQFFVSLPLTVKAAKNSFALVPIVYEEIAMTLGSSPRKAFFDTTFKIAFPGILSGLLLTWLRSIGEFGATLLVGGGIPFKTENIPVNIYINMSSGRFRYAIAASSISIVMVIMFLILVKVIAKLSRRSDSRVR